MPLASVTRLDPLAVGVPVSAGDARGAFKDISDAFWDMFDALVEMSDEF